MSREERERLHVADNPNVEIDFEGMTVGEIIEKYHGVTWKEFDRRMKEKYNNTSRE